MASDLDLDWEEPEDGNYAGYYYGNNEVRIGNGKRFFWMRLAGSTPDTDFNIAVVYRAGVWEITSKKAKQIFTITEVHEVVEAWVRAFPFSEELTIRFRAPW